MSRVRTTLVSFSATVSKGGGLAILKNKKSCTAKTAKKNRASAFYFLGPILDVRKILAQAITHQIAHHFPSPIGQKIMVRPCKISWIVVTASKHSFLIVYIYI